LWVSLASPYAFRQTTGKRTTRCIISVTGARLTVDVDDVRPVDASGPIAHVAVVAAGVRRRHFRYEQRLVGGQSDAVFVPRDVRRGTGDGAARQLNGGAGQRRHNARRQSLVDGKPRRHCTRTDRNPSCHIDLHTHAGSAFDNRVTLTFDLLTSASMHAERLP